MKKLSPSYRLVVALCLLLAGCAIPAEAPIGMSYGIREYFWQPNGSKLIYDVFTGSNTVAVRHTVTLVQREDTIEATDRSGSDAGHITAGVSDQSIAISDIRSSALFPLPTGSYVSKYSTEQKLKSFFPVTNFHYWSEGAVAFTNQGWYFSKDRITWSTDSSTFDAPITVVASIKRDGIWHVYAGSVSGTLYHSEDGGNSWFIQKASLGGAVRTIIVLESGAILLAIEDKNVYLLKGGLFSELGQQLPTNQITGIALITKNLGDHVVIASTRNKGLIRTSVVGNESWKPYESSLTAKELTGIYGANMNLIVTQSDGVFHTSTDTANTWTKADLTLGVNGEEITHANVAATGFAIATDAGNIFYQSFDSHDVFPIANIGKSISTLALREDGQFYAASDLGIKKISTNSSSEDVGPFVLVTDSARGDLVLLRSDGSDLTIGKSWDAGNLYLPQSPLANKYVPITARVLERLDTLRADNEVFADVFVVRYSFEAANTQPFETTPYWLIYFGHGIGPVMIDQISNSSSLSTPLSRAVYKGRE